MSDLLKDWLNAMEDSIAQNDITRERLFTVMRQRINTLNEEKEQLKARVAELEQANEWVSIDDRLPEINERVLVFKPKADKEIISTHRCYLKRNSGNGAIFFNEARCYGGLATHWKPLPTPPEGK